MEAPGWEDAQGYPAPGMPRGLGGSKSSGRAVKTGSRMAPCCPESGSASVGAWAQCWTAFTEAGAFHKLERECADSVTRTMPTSVCGSAPEQVPRSSHQHSPLVPPTSFTDPVRMHSEVETSGSGET